MKKITILIFTLICSLAGFAQKETYNWTFGRYAGLTWNTTRDMLLTGILGTPDATLKGLPTAWTSKIRSDEGCFTLSDKDGKLLMYSDGITIWNRNGGVMETGLTGHYSSAQSGIIFPYPESTTKYVVVSINFAGGFDGVPIPAPNKIAYTVVDMTLNGGLGGVVSGQKNIPIYGQGVINESLTCISSDDGTYYWIIAPGRNGLGYFNAWKFTKDGLVATPVVSYMNSLPKVANYGAYGYIKLTPDGKRFIYSGLHQGIMIYGDFDMVTGKATNIKYIQYNPYSVEFSPNGKYLYVGPEYTNLYVFDLNGLFDDSKLTPIKTVPLFPDKVMALQLGPDKRIYTSRGFIIDNPDDPFNLRIYDARNTVGFLQNSTDYTAGLPSFAANLFQPNTTMPVNPMIRTRPSKN